MLWLPATPELILPPERPAIICPIDERARRAHLHIQQLIGFGVAPSGGAPISAPVDLGSTSGSGGASTISRTTLSNVLAGGVIVLGVHCNNVTCNSVSDGSAYTKILEIANSTNRYSMWYRGPIASQLNSGTTVTATLSGNSIADHAMAMCKIDAGLISSPLDISNSATAASTSPSVATGALAQANEIVIGWLAGFNSGAAITEDAAFTRISTVSGYGSDSGSFDLAYKIVSATSSVTWNPTTTTSIGGVIEVAAFKGS